MERFNVKRLMYIETPLVTVYSPKERIIYYLSHTDNFGKLMPEQVSCFCCGEDPLPWFSFRVEGMPEMKMELAGVDEFGVINYVSPEGWTRKTIEFQIKIADTNAYESRVMMSIEAEVNPFVKMMVEKPLRNFLNEMIRKLNETQL